MTQTSAVLLGIGVGVFGMGVAAAYLWTVRARRAGLVLDKARLSSTASGIENNGETCSTLAFADVVGWFVERRATKESQPTIIAFTLVTQAGTAYRIVQGLFDKATSTVVEGRAVHAQALDPEFSAIHAENELVVYE